jgi:two-component system alkaline phosphatase synthesis response regulator PhoP
MKRILIIDDEEQIRELISYNLIKEGFQVDTAPNGYEGLNLLNDSNDEIDLVLLDVMMPDMDGIEVCDSIRKNARFDHVIVCFLTARNEDYSQIAGLDAGADDYISKPVKPKVLISRIKALLRRKRGQKKDTSTSGLSIDREKYLVNLNGKVIHLPKKEFELLALLTLKPGNVYEREVILDSVWGKNIIVGDRTIDVHIRKLREKIGKKYIQTIKGVGYKFMEDLD